MTQLQKQIIKMELNTHLNNLQFNNQKHSVWDYESLKRRSESEVKRMFNELLDQINETPK